MMAKIEYHESKGIAKNLLGCTLTIILPWLKQKVYKIEFIMKGTGTFTRKIKDFINIDKSTTAIG